MRASIAIICVSASIAGVGAAVALKPNRLTAQIAAPATYADPGVPAGAAPVVFVREPGQAPYGYNVSTAVPVQTGPHGPVRPRPIQAQAQLMPGAGTAVVPVAAPARRIPAPGAEPVIAPTRVAAPVSAPAEMVHVAPAAPPLVAPLTLHGTNPIMHAQPMAAPAQTTVQTTTAEGVVISGALEATSTGPGGTQVVVPVNAMGERRVTTTTTAPADPGNISRAPLVSVVTMPTVLMTQRVVMPVQRPAQ